MNLGQRLIVGGQPKQGALPPDALSLQGFELYRSTDFSTTDTVSYYPALRATIQTTLARGAIYVRGQVAVRHSAPPALVSVGIAIDLGPSFATGYTVVAQDDIVVSSASGWTPVDLGALVDIETYGLVPGPQRLYMTVRNGTAGTLTVRGSSYQWLLDAFELAGTRVLALADS